MRKKIELAFGPGTEVGDVRRMECEADPSWSLPESGMTQTGLFQKRQDALAKEGEIRLEVIET